MSHTKHDWYVFDQGRVHGPYSAEVLQSVEKTDRAMISRRGLQQWYPIDHLVYLLDKTGALSSESKSMLHEFSRVVDSSLERVEATAKVVKSPIVKAQMIQVSKRHSDKSEPVTDENAASKQCSSFSSAIQDQSQAPIEVEKKLSRKQKKKLLRQQEYKARKRNKNKTEGGTPPHSQSVGDSVVDLDELYLLLRGRLRLGMIRGSSFGLFASYVVTAGLSLISCFSQQYKEASYHCSGVTERLGWSKFLAPVPIFCAVPIWKLASLISRMEAQNKYQHLSRNMVLFASFCPPVSAMFLQGAMNRHWYLHINAAARTKLKNLSQVGSGES